MTEIETYTDFKAEVFYNESRLQGTKKPSITHIAWNLIPKDKKEVVEPEAWEISGAVDPQMNIDTLSLIREVEEMTGLDDASALAIVNNAKKHGMEKQRLLETCEKSMQQKYDNLGAYINSMVSRGGFSPEVASPETKQQGRRKAKDTFNNFEQRDYDYKELERKLFNQ